MKAFFGSRPSRNAVVCNLARLDDTRCVFTLCLLLQAKTGERRMPRHVSKKRGTVVPISDGVFI